MNVKRKTLIFLLTALVLFGSIPLSDVVRRRAAVHRVVGDVAVAAETFGVPPALILAVIRTESDFDPNAVSRAGAIGYMQLLPETFMYLRDERGDPLPDDAVKIPAVNIRYGAYYLSRLYGNFGDWPTALAAYNAGEGRVLSWLGDPTLTENGRLTRIPYPETERYVTKVLRAYEKYKDDLQRSST